MSERPATEPKKARRWLRWLSLAFIVLLVFAAAAVLTVRTDWFASKVRERIVVEIENTSGGRTELGTFRFNWETLTASVDNFILHGTENSSEAPLLRITHVNVGLGVTSLVHVSGIHVRSIEVDEPAIHIIATEDGATNLPTPKTKTSDHDFIDTLLDLAARTITVRHGSLRLNERRIPLDLAAEDVNLLLTYNRNRNAKPLYTGGLSSRRLTIANLPVGPFTFGLDSQLTLEHGVLTVAKAKLSTKESRIEVSGFAYHLLNPASSFGVYAAVSLSEWGNPLHLPLERRGVVQFAGKVSLELSEKFRYVLEGSVKGRGMALNQERVRVEGIAVDTLVRITPEQVATRHLRIAALDGQFNGAAALEKFRKLTVEGEIKDLRAARLANAAGQKLPYSANVNGSVHLETEVEASRVINTVFKTNLALTGVTPENPGDLPLDGLLNATYTQSNASIALENSRFSTASSEIDVNGTIGRRLDVNAHSSRLADIQPFLTEPLPITLNNGNITFAGFVSGPLDNPRVDGKGSITNFIYEEQHIDQVSADFSLTRQSFEARSFSGAQNPLKVDGSGTLELEDWKAGNRSPFKARVTVRGARIEKLLAEFKQDHLPIGGALTATANLHGDPSAIAGDAQLTAESVTAWDEEIDRIRASVQLTPELLEVTEGAATFHKIPISFSGAFGHKPDDWKSGSLSWKLRNPALDLTQVRNFQTRYPQWKGLLTSNTSGSAAIQNETFQLTALNGDAIMAGISYEGRAIGQVDTRAASSGPDLSLTANVVAHGGRASLAGQWKLEPGYPGGGSITMSSVSIQTLREIALPADRPPLPFSSALEGSATFDAPLAGFVNKFTAEVTLRRIFVAPGQEQKLRAGAKEQDLILENAKPVKLHVTLNSAVIETAIFKATNTNVEVGGKIGFDEKQGWDLAVKGGLNLAQLQMFKQDLLASGNASVDATVRGNLVNPQVNGTLALKNASLYFGELPTGLDNLNGVVSFDRNRATLQSMTAESGGGKMSLTGFVGFGGTALVYRLQGNASGVRVRYPEGASTSVNASLNLTGTSQESLLAGTVTIVRAAFTPRSDLGSLMAELTRTGAPAPPQDNDYIRGMQLDVHIESTPSLEFQTSLTRGLEAEVDLHLRGTAARPTLLGNVGFSEGEISLFGNKYTLNRGDIRFFNPTKIEPVFDLEADTRARGIDVNITFSGTPSKLNVAYRSDPPLQPSEIIALLAIGRDPNVSAGIASSQITQQSTAAGLGNVVGEAVASSVTNRLQKFFGITRIKIDPQLTGLDNIPQARLTLEQQVSKDITLTFITNIARTQEQIVRIEWGFSREWSAIAVREENGLFGVDFQYKKRFK